MRPIGRTTTMRYTEYWGERVNPGNVGKIAVGEEHEPCQCKPLVFVRFLFVIIALPVAWVLAIPYVPLPMWQAAIVVIGGTLIYVAMSYLVDPQPDLENIGHLGGLVDNKTRYSDDLNRLLQQAQYVLGPGRFVAESLFDIKCFFVHEEKELAAAPEDAWR
ncbi:hypothetical protein LCGC14_2900150 [marine sediment metagenome]|uniref:Uncharacterized protein n=1 Tax=marine sediment metagenome TaxID=412755 RepID=A0A0F8YGJ1_9ZZZZ